MHVLLVSAYNVTIRIEGILHNIRNIGSTKVAATFIIGFQFLIETDALSR